MSYPIVPMPPDLWPAVREIYREGIATGNATFETELPSWEKWDGSHRKNCRLIALEPRDEAIPEVLIPLDGVRVLGWGRTQPGLESTGVCGSCGGFGVCDCCRAGAWRGQSPAAGVSAVVGGKRNLDAAGWSFSGKRREYRAAQGLRVSAGRGKAAHRQTRRHLERCGLDGETKLNCR